MIFTAAINLPGSIVFTSLCLTAKRSEPKRKGARGGFPATPRVTRYCRAGSISAMVIGTADAPGADKGSVYTMEARTYIQAALGEDLGAEQRKRTIYALCKDYRWG